MDNELGTIWRDKQTCFAANCKCRILIQVTARRHVSKTLSNIDDGVFKVSIKDV